MTTSFSFGYGGSGEEVDGRCSCEDMRALCGRVASGGSRHTGSERSLLGSDRCDSRIGRMVLWKWHSGGGGGRVLGRTRIR